MPSMKFDIGSKKPMTPFNIAENVGITGLKHICEKRTNVLRRCVWILALLSMTIWMSVQFYDSIRSYLARGTVISKRVISPDVIQFPAITLCNVNTLRARSIYSMENGSYSSPTLYQSIVEFYRLVQPNVFETAEQRENRLLEFIQSNGPFLDKWNPRNFMEAAAHQRESLIQRCSWDGDSCDYMDFDPVMTDAGLCYTFNKNASLHVKSTESGLRIVLSVEPWDYIHGPRSAIGAIIYIHDQSEMPSLVASKGQIIQSGTLTSMKIRQAKETNLPAPYGDCGDETLAHVLSGTPYTAGNCVVERMTRHMAEACGCVDFYMTGNISCTFSELISCSQVTTGVDSVSNDTCAIPCQVTRYDVTVSQVQYSDRYSKMAASEDSAQNWPETPENNPLFIQSWIFLNEANSSFTDTIWTLSSLLYDIVNTGTEVISGSDVLLKLIDKNSSQYDDVLNFQLDLKFSLYMNVESKSCDDMPNMKRCMTAVLASEQLRLIMGSIETCYETERLLNLYRNGYERLKTSLSNFTFEYPEPEDHDGSSPASDHSTNSSTANELNKVKSSANAVTATVDPETLNNIPRFGNPSNTKGEKVISNNAVNDGNDSKTIIRRKMYTALTTKVEKLLEHLTNFRTVCDPFRDKMAEFWRSYHFKQKEVVDMIRNPGPHILKLDVNVEDMTFTEVKQTRAYPWTSLISDIGGTLGLCLGGSVLTLLEIVDVLVSWSWYKREDNPQETSEMKN